MDVNALSQALALLGSWEVALGMLAGAVIGAVVGALPGLAGPIGMAIVLPFAFGLQPITAILMLSTTYTTSIAAGSIPAITLNVPGTPAAVPTALAGFPMARRGHAASALGCALYSSAVGVIASYVLMALLLLPVIDLVSHMGPADRMAVSLAAVLIVAELGRSPVRGLIAGALGMLLGTLGSTPAGIPRVELGVAFQGIPLIPALLGLVGFSEVLKFVVRDSVVDVDGRGSRPSAWRVLAGFRDWSRHKLVSLASAAVGFVLGVIPGAGATVAALVVYSQAKVTTEGRDDQRGLIAAETSNNASEGGAMLTLLALGIPGSGAAAILLSGFLIFGLFPGPLWLPTNLDFAYAVIIGNILFALAIVPILALSMGLMSRAMYVPTRFLVPSLAVLGSLGVFTLEGQVWHILALWIFAYIGYALDRGGYPPVAVVLGLLLGPIIEAEAYRASVIYSDNLVGLLLRPVVAASLLVGLVVFIRAFWRQPSKRARAAGR